MLRNHHHHHHVALSVRISQTLSHHPSQSFIGRSSGLYLISAQSFCMYVLAGRPAFACPCEGVHMSTSLVSSSLLLQQCPTCLVCLILIVFVVGSWWPYSCCFVGCCLQDLFNIARSTPKSLVIDIYNNFCFVCIIFWFDCFMAYQT